VQKTHQRLARRGRRKERRIPRRQEPDSAVETENGIFERLIAFPRLARADPQAEIQRPETAERIPGRGLRPR
jgi:hypothetical protein